MPALRFVPMKQAPDDWRGRKVKDLVSEFIGYAAGRFEYINGCVRIQVEGTDKDGSPVGFVFDEQQLAWANSWIAGFKPEEIAKPARTAKSVSRPGGPRPAPTVRRSPVR